MPGDNREKARPRYVRLLIDVATALAWVAAALSAAVLLSGVGMPRVSMIFLSAVVFASVTRGARAGVLAAVVAFAAFDYFWVPPIHQVELRTPYEVMTLAIFLGLGVVTALSSGGLRDGQRRSAARERMLLAFAQAHALLAMPAEAAAAGAKIAEWSYEIARTGTLYVDADGTEARAGAAETWWDNVLSSLRTLAERACLEPGRTHRSGDFRARALCDSGEVQGALVWLAPDLTRGARRDIDDYIAAVVDLAAVALRAARRFPRAA